MGSLSRQLALLLALGGVLAAWVVAAPAATGNGLEGSWVGSYADGEAAFGLTLAGTRATVALGVGRSGVQVVGATRQAGRLRVAIPGRPTRLVLTARLRSGRLVGTAVQGARRRSFVAERGGTAAFVAPGLFGMPGRVQAVVADPYGPPRLLDLRTGRVRAIALRGTAFDVGSGFGTTAPRTGTLRIDAGGAILGNTRLPRVAIRQLEVRFRSGSATLSGTLTLPPGRGRHPAVAFVSGSGPTARAYLPDLQLLLVANGVAVLAYDKRGVGESGGAYPGESPVASTIDVLARDAAAAVRFLAAQPEVDPARVGLAGHSQAGWITPLAAVREPAVRFVVCFACPAVTADEVDLFQTLTGQGDRRPTLDDAAIEARVLAAGPGGVDPAPSLRRLRIPSLWVYGARDRHIPSRLSAARLEPLAGGRDLTVSVLPAGNHALVETATGLTSEMLRSDRFAPGLFADVRAWLRRHGL